MLIANAVANATLALAVITGVLALATVCLAFTTWAGIRSARKDAANEITAMRETTDDEIKAMRETAAEQVAAARDELDASHRPLLIEVSATGPVYPDMGARANPNIHATATRLVPQTIELTFDNARSPEEIDPRIVVVRLERGMAFVSVPLRNVGRGLAIVDETNITLEGTGLGSLKAPPVARRVRVPVNETTRVVLIANFLAGKTIPAADRWRLHVPYTDFAGRQRTGALIQLGYRGPDAATGEWEVTAVDGGVTEG
jgi:hypothetical protein